MKIMTKIALAAGITLGSTLGSQAWAHDDNIAASPKLRQMIEDSKRVGGAPGDKIDRSLKPMSAKLAVQAESQRIVPSAGGDTVDRSSVPMSPKLKAMLGTREFKIAPVK